MRNDVMAIYLDNAATTKPCTAAVEAALEVMRANYGNPSSLHRAGLDAQLAVDKSRKIIADSLGVDSSTVYFTSGATESNNLALRGASAAYGRKRRRIVISSVEHASVEETAADLEKRDFEVVRVTPGKNGRFSAMDFFAACNDDTCLLSMMSVNNETGDILPVAEVFAAVKRKFPHIITHCDCVQAYMKIPVKPAAMNADIVSLSAHKIHGVKGVGAIYIKKGVRVLPLVTGGKQEKGIRSGTESVPLIAAFGAAVDELLPTMNERFSRVAELKRHLLGLIDEIDGISVNSHDEASPYVINISAEGKHSEIMLHFLENRGIYVSSGSACSKGKQSGVLEQYRIPMKRADSAIRVSITADTTVEELDSFVEALTDGIKKIRS